jgi:hypothetical protein
LIKGTARWTSKSGSPGAVPDGIELTYDDPDNWFAAFAMRLAEYYGERGVHHWIILNEPDIREGEGIVEFEGGVRDYANLIKVAYQAIKAVDADAHVQIAGVPWWYDRTAQRVPCDGCLAHCTPIHKLKRATTILMALPSTSTSRRGR